MKNKKLIIGGGLLIAAVIIYFVFFHKKASGKIQEQDGLGFEDNQADFVREQKMSKEAAIEVLKTDKTVDVLEYSKWGTAFFKKRKTGKEQPTRRDSNYSVIWIDK